MEFIMSSGKVLLDDLPLSKFHLKITALTFGAHLVDGYILGLIGITMTRLPAHMGSNDPFWSGFIGSSALIGLFLGSLFFGRISDRLGRQKIFSVSFVVISLGSLLQFYVNTPLELALCRIFLGIGLGGDYSVGHALLAEFCPKKHRGPILGSFSVIWTMGYVAATFVGTALLSSSMLGDDAWRWVLASPCVPAILICLARIGTPESPRWLANQGRPEQAQAVLTKVFGPNVILGDEIVNHHQSTGYKVLFDRKYIKRTLFNCIFFVCIVMPYFAIYTFLPKILEQMNIAEGFVTGLLLNCMLIIGALIGIWCTIQFTRRGFLINSFIILTVGLLGLAILPVSQTVLMIVIFAAFTLTLSAVSNLVGVFPAESFPTEVRSSGIGLATAVSRFGSALSTFCLPVSMYHLGISSTMILLAAVTLIGTIVSWLWAPETKELSLAKAVQVDTCIPPSVTRA